MRARCWIVQRKQTVLLATTWKMLEYIASVCEFIEDLQITKAVRAVGSIFAPVSLGNNGLVMIQYSSELRPICAVGWDGTTANVTCRQLTFASATSVTTISMGPETLAWLTDIRCNGDETALSYCTHSGFLRQNCSNNRFAAVSCSK